MAANLDDLARQFERFARLECERSPLYRRLALGVAGDPDLLSLAAPGQAGPKPNLLLASAHYLLLKGERHRLAAFYPSVSGSAPPSENPYPDFRAFCLEHAAQIHDLMATRRVQTNEVARCAFLLPAFCLLALREPGRPLATVEVGASAGLLLLWDQYDYDYGDGRHYGSPESPLQLRCALRGSLRPPLLAALPAVAARVGIDLHPVDVRDPDEALWLRALVWGDQPERAERLRQAIAVAHRRPPRLVAGDALDALPEVLAGLPPEATTVVFHSHTMNQFIPEARRQFEKLLATYSARKVIYRLSLEGSPSGGQAQSAMELSVFTSGQKLEQQLLAYYHPHGEWLEWLLT
jgi:hypothetical protein